MSTDTIATGEVSILVTVTLEADDTYSFGIEDASLPEDNENRYITGLSEGQETDPAYVARFAGETVGECIAEGFGLVPMLYRKSEGEVTV